MRTVREVLVQAVAESLYGEGCYPFNAATGFTVQHESESAAEAILAAFKREQFQVWGPPNPDRFSE